MDSVNAANVQRFCGFADLYDRYRPTPPIAIVDLLTQLIETPRPKLVVDIGSGSGLSTRIWKGRADKIIGIEPGADMRAHAVAQSRGDSEIEYREGHSHDTQLCEGCADVVTISQALHWMEPELTFAEVSRILRPGGIFAAYDCDWPPTITAELSEAYREFDQASRALEKRIGASPAVTHYNKSGHLDRIRASNRFAMVWELALHSIESGDANRLVQLALTQGDVQACFHAGVTQERLGVPSFRATAESIFAGRSLPWYFTYRIRIGLKRT